MIAYTYKLIHTHTHRHTHIHQILQLCSYICPFSSSLHPTDSNSSFSFSFPIFLSFSFRVIPWHLYFLVFFFYFLIFLNTSSIYFSRFIFLHFTLFTNLLILCFSLQTSTVLFNYCQFILHFLKKDTKNNLFFST